MSSSSNLERWTSIARGCCFMCLIRFLLWLNLNLHSLHLNWLLSFSSPCVSISNSSTLHFWQLKSDPSVFILVHGFLLHINLLHEWHCFTLEVGLNPCPQLEHFFLIHNLDFFLLLPLDFFDIPTCLDKYGSFPSFLMLILFVSSLPFFLTEINPSI